MDLHFRTFLEYREGMPHEYTQEEADFIMAYVEANPL